MTGDDLQALAGGQRPVRGPSGLPGVTVDLLRRRGQPQRRNLLRRRLHTLATRVAAGDRAAFCTVCPFLVMQVWRDAVRLLPPADAGAVTRSTFVDLWHLAGHHLDRDECETHAWIQAIAARHIEDRLSTTDAGRPFQSDHDHHTHRELISLLGPR